MPSFDANSFLAIYTAAVLKKDVEGLMALYDPHIVAFDMWSDWSLEGAGSWGDMNRAWLGSLGSETVVVEFDDIHVFPGDDIAGLSAIVTFSARAETGKALRSMQNRLTWVAARRGNSWKIVHQHTSAPIDPRNLTAILRR